MAGVTDYGTNTIFLNKGELNKGQALMHELLHTVCDMWGLAELHDDEKSIDLLASGLYSLLKDNEDLRGLLERVEKYEIVFD